MLLESGFRGLNLLFKSLRLKVLWVSFERKNGLGQLLPYRITIEMTFYKSSSAQR